MESAKAGQDLSQKAEREDQKGYCAAGTPYTSKTFLELHFPVNSASPLSSRRSRAPGSILCLVPSKLRFPASFSLLPIAHGSTALSSLLTVSFFRMVLPLISIDMFMIHLTFLDTGQNTAPDSSPPPPNPVQLYHLEGVTGFCLISRGKAGGWRDIVLM